MEIIAADELQIEEILAIDGECLSPPWTEGQMLSEIYSDHTCFELAIEGEAVLGFCILRKLGDEAELLRIATRPEVRKRGVGSKLLESAIKNAGGRGVGKIFLEMRESNETAASLYDKFGFKVAGMRRAYYEEPVENACVMVLEVCNE